MYQTAAIGDKPIKVSVWIRRKRTDRIEIRTDGKGYGDRLIRAITERRGCSDGIVAPQARSDLNEIICGSCLHRIARISSPRHEVEGPNLRGRAIDIPGRRVEDGTPTQVGTFNFMARGTDSGNPVQTA